VMPRSSRWRARHSRYLRKLSVNPRQPRVRKRSSAYTASRSGTYERGPEVQGVLLDKEDRQMRTCDSSTWTGWFRPQGRRSWLRAVEAESWSACWELLEATTADERGDTMCCLAGRMRMPIRLHKTAPSEESRHEAAAGLSVSPTARSHEGFTAVLGPIGIEMGCSGAIAPYRELSAKRGL
jgi:hypothetical protein